MKFLFETLFINRTSILRGVLCVFLGLMFIYNGLQTNQNVPYLIGSILIVCSFFFLLYDITTNITYYFTDALTSKYSKETKGIITNKEIIYISHTVSRMGRTVLVEELNYLISYNFEYKNEIYRHTFYLDTENQYKKLKIGSTIPIKFSKANPNKSLVVKDLLYENLQ